MLVTVASAPAASAAFPLEKAVFFLDSVGAQLTATAGQPRARTAQAKKSNTTTHVQEVMVKDSAGDKETALSQNDNTTQKDTTASGGRPQAVRYVVEGGDTLSRIAESFGVSVSTITAANNMTTRSTLKIGQELVILPVDGVQHTIVSGETLSHIAQKYKADVDEIITFNNIQNDGRIQPGERIIIPGATPPAARAALAVQKKDAPSPPPQAATAKIDASGLFIFPVTGKITQGLHFLNAVDMGGSAYCGTPVKAAAAGTVVQIANGGWNGGYGHYIKLRHAGGVETIYAHNARNTVANGQQVAQGETIAYMGSTGNSTGCHVHFAVRGANNPFAR